MRRLQKIKGATLIEIMLGMIILVMTVIPLMKMLGDSIKGAQTFGDISIGTQLGQELLEEIKSRKWDENTSPDGSPAPTGSWPLGPEAGEPPYDDVDDYNNYTDTLDNKFVRKVTVNYAAISNTDPAIVTNLAPGVTDYFKKITVRVEWPGHTATPGNKAPVVLTTVRGNYRRY